MSGRSALVTGATGFIGNHLVRRLLADGWSVHVIARATTNTAALPDGVSIIVDDANIDTLTAAITKASPEVCFHLATNFLATHKPRDVNELVESNVTFGARVAEACSVLDDVTFVNVGTVWQHHNARPYGPTSLYGATKQAFQDIVQFYAEVSGLPVVNLELADTYGPNDPRRKVVQLLLETAVSSDKLEMSPGEQLINLVHVSDVLDALLLAPKHATTGAPAFAVPSSDPMNLQQLVALVEDITGSPVPVTFGARPYRPREMMTSWQYAPTLPGWTPSVPLRDGLQSLWTSMTNKDSTNG